MRGKLARKLNKIADSFKMTNRNRRAFKRAWARQSQTAKRKRKGVIELPEPIIPRS